MTQIRTEQVSLLATTALEAIKPLAGHSSPTEVISALLTLGLHGVRIATALGRGEQIRAGVERIYAELPPQTETVH